MLWSVSQQVLGLNMGGSEFAIANLKNSLILFASFHCFFKFGRFCKTKRRPDSKCSRDLSAI